MKERAATVTDVDAKRAGQSSQGTDWQPAAASAWSMPGGEDLLRFALSTGLAAGLWWLQRRGEEAAVEAPAGAAAPRAEESR